MQADPGLAERDAGLLAEFEAAPWLLPPRTKALKHSGVHKLDELLQLRSVAIGNYSKTATLLTFNKRFAIMAQNTSERRSAGCCHAMPCRAVQPPPTTCTTCTTTCRGRLLHSSWHPHSSKPPSGTLWHPATAVANHPPCHAPVCV